MIRKLLTIDVPKNRIYGLDIIRCLAILFVLIGHARFTLPKESFARDLSEFFLFDGVSVFFVLSGFLIGGILIKILEKYKVTSHLLLNFWIRRWFRTLPNYFFVLSILVILRSIYNGEIYFLEYLKYYTFTQNLWYNHPVFFPEAWSLSIEEWFYISVPLLVFIAIKLIKLKPKYSVLIVCVLLLIVVTGFRYYKFYFLVSEPFNSGSEFKQQVVTRLDGIVFGVLGAYINFYHKSYFLKYKKPLLIIGVMGFIILKYYKGNLLFSCTLFFTLISIFTLFTIPFLSQYKEGSGIIHRAVTRISLVSYSMYLFNLSVVYVLIIKRLPNLFNENIESGINYVMFWALTTLFSILTYKFIEVPFMNLRDNSIVQKLFPTKSK